MDNKKQVAGLDCLAISWYYPVSANPGCMLIICIFFKVEEIHYIFHFLTFFQLISQIFHCHVSRPRNWMFPLENSCYWPILIAWWIPLLSGKNAGNPSANTNFLRMDWNEFKHWNIEFILTEDLHYQMGWQQLAFGKIKNHASFYFIYGQFQLGLCSL